MNTLDKLKINSVNHKGNTRIIDFLQTNVIRHFNLELDSFPDSALELLLTELPFVPSHLKMHKTYHLIQIQCAIVCVNLLFIKVNTRGFNMNSTNIQTPCSDKIISVHSEKMLYLVIKYEIPDML